MRIDATPSVARRQALDTDMGALRSFADRMWRRFLCWRAELRSGRLSAVLWAAVPWLLLLLLLIPVAVKARKLWRRRRRRAHRREGRTLKRHPLAATYQRFEQVVAAVTGAPRPRSETDSELLLRLRRSDCPEGLLRLIEHFLASYQQARFGNSKLVAHDLDDLIEKLDTKALRCDSRPPGAV